MGIELQNINKTFGEYKAIDNLSLSIPSGDLIALLGPSGCGKTTLLRIIAGLELADSGKIILENKDTTNLPPREKNVGFVFQHYALFRRLTVFENVAFGLKVLPFRERPPKKEIRERVEHLLKLVQMDWALNRFPSQLSGGQRQRVALARALAVNPRVLLLDEPFSALDAKVRQELRRWLRKLHDEIHVTSIFVTHDQEEALELADTPQEVYDHPANAFVYNFLGNVNVFHGRIHNGKVSLGDHHLDAPDDLKNVEEKTSQTFVRPHEIGISRIRSNDNDLEGTIREVRLQGGQIGLNIECEGLDSPIEAEVPRELFVNLQLAKGVQVFVTINRVRVFTGDYEI